MRTKTRSYVTVDYMHGAVMVHFAIRRVKRFNNQYRSYRPTPTSFRRLTETLIRLDRKKGNHDDE